MRRHDDVVRSNSRELPGRFAYSAFSGDLDLAPRRKLAEVVEMTPEEMANASRVVTSAYNELLAVAASLEDPEYRRLMTECVARPKITFLEMYPGDQDRRRLFGRRPSVARPDPIDVSTGGDLHRPFLHHHLCRVASARHRELGAHDLDPHVAGLDDERRARAARRDGEPRTAALDDEFAEARRPPVDDRPHGGIEPGDRYGNVVLGASLRFGQADLRVLRVGEAAGRRSLRVVRERSTRTALVAAMKPPWMACGTSIMRPIASPAA